MKNYSSNCLFSKESLRDNIGGNVSKITRETYELETGNRAITSDNAIDGRYIDYKE